MRTKEEILIELAKIGNDISNVRIKMNVIPTGTTFAHREYPILERQECALIERRETLKWILNEK